MPPGSARAARPGSVSGRALAGELAAADPEQQKKQVDRGIAELREQLQETAADLANAYIALRTTQAALPGARAALERASAAASSADAHNDDMAVRLDVARANEARAVEELTRTGASIRDSRDRVARFASQMYQEQGMGQLSVALSATSPDEFATRIALTEMVMSVQSQSMDRLATAQAAATAQEAHVKALRAEVAAAKVAAEQALARAEAARATASAAKQRLDALAAQQSAQAAVVQSRKAADQRQLLVQQRESDRLQRVLAERARQAKIAAQRAAKIAAEKARRANQARLAREAAAREAAARAKKRYVAPPPPPPPPPPPAQKKGGYLTAPSNAWISSEFGMRLHPIYQTWRLHAGRDYAGNCGSPVYAPASGTIISAGEAGGAGNQVVIDHGVLGGVSLVTVYNHLSGFARTGGQVSRGQVIAYVGTTGTSTGCHLHFETREDGVPVDPRKWL